VALLFLGEQSLFAGSMESGIRDDGFPIFFAAILPESLFSHTAGYAAVIMPAKRFLALAPLQLAVPVLASGPPGLLAECLNAGCADYLRIPWSIEEVEARLARYKGAGFSIAGENGTWDGQMLHGPGGHRSLSPGLTALLNLLLANQNAWVPREALAAVLGVSKDNSRAIDMQVSRLRGIFIKLGLRSAAFALQSTPGSYRFSLPDKLMPKP
jgi:hypothetical protein